MSKAISASVQAGELSITSVEAMLRPQSIAVVGSLGSPGSLGGALLDNLDRFSYSGDIHLVSRGRDFIGARRCFPSIDDLPNGVDAVALIVPEAAVLDSVSACIRRGAKSALVFAGGFAETGEVGRERQVLLANLARAGSLAINGPNSIGLSNLVDGIPLTFERMEPQPKIERPGIGIVAQSGGMVGTIRAALAAKAVPISYVISTGNEAVCGIEDFLSFFINDPNTAVAAIFAEQIRRPMLFLHLVRKARQRNKAVAVMHPGRSDRGKKSAQSHTGALAGDYAVMETLLRREGVLVVETLDELIDVATLLSYKRTPPVRGPGILTNSGAFRGIALDFCQDIDLEIPELSAKTAEGLAKVLPEFATVDNPVDVTTAGMTNPNIFGEAAMQLLDDPRTGSLLVSVMGGSPKGQLSKVQSLLPVMTSTSKPVALVMFGDEAPIAEDALALVRDSGVPFFRSPDRAMRALAKFTELGHALQKAQASKPAAAATAKDSLPTLKGVVPEYLSKQVLRKAGFAIPPGELSKDVEEACKIAAAIGYPVVLKAQAAALSHKSNSGGVALGIADERSLREAWQRMTQRIKSLQPSVALDGILVETMAPQGLELIIGARRDPDWGPILMVGLGGIMAETLKDVRLLPADVGADWIMEELGKLRAAAILRGFRGAPPADLSALADALMRLGALIRTSLEIADIEINPLIVYPEGKGVLCLDALIICSDDH